MKNRIIFDLVFWVFIKGYEILFYGSGNNDFSYALNTSLSRFPAELVLYYTGMNYILPKYFELKNSKKLIIQFAVALLIAAVAHRTGRFIFFPKSRLDDNFIKTVFSIPQLLVAPFYFLPIPAIGFMIYIFKRVNQNEIQSKEVEKQKAIAEMNLLKSQIQPHFLFNTLNNLYSLSIQDSKQTPGFILKLSGLMEYMLYNATSETVTLDMEIRHIENYVDLEKIRYGNRLEVSWDIDKGLYETRISPLLLFPFIENAFKHGASKDDENTWISISLKKESKWLVYTVVNSVPDSAKKYASTNGGLGLTNLASRLQLSYAGQYELNRTSAEGSYMSVLQLAIL
ncbi:MAG: histidine kinase [Ferruginibacter sp.]|nr:histidine kinase [Ferruginibacter sp.]